MSVHIPNKPHSEDVQPAAGRTPVQDGWLSVSIIPIVISISGIVFYTIGWSYLYGYYSAFGLSLDEINFDTREIMLFASQAFAGWVYISFLPAAIIVGFGRLLQKRRARGKRRQTLALQPSHADERLALGPTERRVWAGVSVWLSILLLVPMSRVSIGRGRHDATRQMKESSTNLPMVSLAIDKNKLPQALFTESVTDGLLEGFHLLAHGKSGYYLVKPTNQEVSIPGRTFNVVFIPYSSVLGDKIGVAIPTEVK